MNALAYHAPPVLDRLLQRSSLLEAEAFELWSASKPHLEGTISSL